MRTRLPSVALGAAVYALLSILLAVATARASGALASLSLCGLCGVMIAGPLVAVRHAARRAPILAGPAAGVGALAAALGALVSAGLTEALMALGALPTLAEQAASEQARATALGVDPQQAADAIAAASSGAFGDPLVMALLTAALAALLGAAVGALAAPRR